MSACALCCSLASVIHSRLHPGFISTPLPHSPLPQPVCAIGGTCAGPNATCTCTFPNICDNNICKVGCF